MRNYLNTQVAAVFGIVTLLCMSATNLARAQSTPTTYYVDCTTGADSNGGTTVSTAWRSVAKVNAASLQPGDKILFKRGCTWTSATNGSFLTAKWTGTPTQPISIGAYGTGSKPVLRQDARGNTATPATNQHTIMVTGAYQVIQDIKTMTLNHGRDTTCTQEDGSPAKIGFYSGFSVQGAHNTLQDLESEDQSLGVFLQDSSRYNKVLRVYVHHMSTFWRIYHAGKALGSIGVNLHGDDNEVAYSRFDNNNAACTDATGEIHDYSAPFEVYNANRAYVHHITAFGHRKHFEMGKDTDKTSADNVLAYSLFVSDHPEARGPNIHDANNQFGPVLRTQVYNNTIVFTGANSQAMIGSAGGTYKNNILVAESKAAFYGDGTTEANNIYWDFRHASDASADPCVQFAGSGCSPLSQINDVNPLFIQPQVSGGNFHLQAASPAKNTGAVITSTDALLRSILATDLDALAVPQETGVDIGAYEYTSVASTSTPIPTENLVPGDANGDSRVDAADYVIWLTNFGRSTSSGRSEADFNNDQKVNALDFAVFLIQ